MSKPQAEVILEKPKTIDYRFYRTTVVLNKSSSDWQEDDASREVSRRLSRLDTASRQCL